MDSLMLDCLPNVGDNCYMKTFRRIGLQITGSFIFLVGFGCTSDTVTNGNLVSETPPSREYLDICDIRGNTSLSQGQFIRVKGRVTGYHELILYSDDCPGTDNLIELDFEPQERRRLIEMSRRSNSDETDVSGEVRVYGQFSPGNGRLFGYPPEIIDLNKSPEPNEGVRVNKMLAVKLEAFSPL